MISAQDLNDPNSGRLMVAPASGGALTDLTKGYEGDVADFAWHARGIGLVKEDGPQDTLQLIEIIEP